MEMKLATRSQRFLVYLIDYIIPSMIISGVFLPLFYKLIHFDSSILETNTKALSEVFLDFSLNPREALGEIFDILPNFLSYFFVDLAFNSLFIGVFLFLYLVILAKFWKGQTIGRVLMKVRVVKKNGDDMEFKNIILREVVGVILLYVILNNLLTGIILASAVLAYIDGRSLPDYISGTCMITEKAASGIYPNSPFKFKSSEDENIIDANVEEIPNDNTDDNDNSNDNEDEYTIL